MSYFYVYMLFRADGTPFYIGKGQGKRIVTSCKPNYSDNHHKNSVIRQTIDALGSVPYVILHKNLDETDALDYEKALISAVGRHPCGPLVNMTDGGEGISNAAPEIRKKISDALTGNKNSLGMKHTTETRAKLTACKIGNRGPLGLKQSAEHIQKRVDKTRAWAKTEEGRAYLASQNKGRIVSDETRAKIKAARARQAENDPDFASRMSALQTELWSDTAYRTKMSEAFSKRPPLTDTQLAILKAGRDIRNGTTEKVDYRALCGEDVGDCRRIVLLDSTWDRRYDHRMTVEQYITKRGDKKKALADIQWNRYKGHIELEPTSQ